MMKVRLSFLEKRQAARYGLLPAKINPIIIVPGLLGTWPPAPAPTGRIDPVSNIYTNLVDGLRTIGYVRGVSLFVFPYDWRVSIADSARKLGAEIERVRRLGQVKMEGRSPVVIDYSRVDLLGHSLGGLVARAYVQAEHYKHDVARLLTVASPHKGLMAAYYAWEGGDSSYIGVPVEAARSMVSLIQAREMPTLWKRAHTTYRIVRKQITPDLYEYLTVRTPAVRDLLPTADEQYLYSLDENGSKRIYPFGPEPGYPVNLTLEKLNEAASLAELKDLEEFHLFYSSTNRTPIRALVADNFASTQPMFAHGQPLLEQPEENFGGGDNIVPVSSGSLALPADTLAALPLQRTDLSKALNIALNHVQIVGDPDPVRYILSVVARHSSPERITPQIWDGPPVSKRRPNIAALFR